MDDLHSVNFFPGCYIHLAGGLFPSYIMRSEQEKATKANAIAAIQKCLPLSSETELEMSFRPSDDDEIRLEAFKSADTELFSTTDINLGAGRLTVQGSAAAMTTIREIRGDTMTKTKQNFELGWMQARLRVAKEKPGPKQMKLPDFVKMYSNERGDESATIRRKLRLSTVIDRSSGFKFRIDATKVWESKLDIASTLPRVQDKPLKDVLGKKARVEVEMEVLAVPPDADGAAVYQALAHEFMFRVNAPITHPPFYMASGVSTVPLMTDQKADLRRAYRAAVEDMMWSPRDEVKFLGPKPRALEFENFVALVETPGYTLTDKADGQRHLLFVTPLDDGKRVFIINEKMQFFPIKFDEKVDLSSLDGTILDAEVLDTGKILVFDAYRGPSSAEKKGSSGGGGSGSLADLELDARLSVATTVVKRLVQASVDIIVKTFVTMDGTPESFHAACKTILETVRDWNGDGLIFTPARGRIPFGKSYLDAFKWKPVEESTVDFLVRFECNNINMTAEGGAYCETSPLVSARTYGELITAYKYISRTASTPTTAESKMELVALPEPFDKIRIACATATSPAANANASANGSASANGNANANGSRKRRIQTCVCETLSGDAFRSDSIVECGYNMTSSRWEAKRVRSDKVQPNSLMTAMSTIRTISKPVTERHLLGEIEAVPLPSTIVIRDDGGEYYTIQESSGVRPMQSTRTFHNKVKRALFAAVEFASVFDFGVGVGGDLDKVITQSKASRSPHPSPHHRLLRMVGIDTSPLNISDPNPARKSAYGRILKHDSDRASEWKYRDVAQIVLLPMDATKDVTKSENLILSQPDRALAGLVDTMWGDKVVGPFVARPVLSAYKGFASQGFDLASCMFAIHYMFESDQFFANVKRVVKPNGFFIGACLDATKVREALSTSPQMRISGSASSSPTSQQQHGRGVSSWSIAASARDGDGAVTDIDVFMPSIGKVIPEKLVDYDVLKAKFKASGFVEHALAESRGILPKGPATGTFGDIAGFGDLPPSEQAYSSLNRWFIFRRVK